MIRRVLKGGKQMREVPHNELIADEGILKIGSVIQIKPTWQERFGACLAIVDEVSDWGVQAGIPVPGTDGVSTAYVRVEWDDFEYIGEAPWVPQTEENDDENV
jgi:hypothetical protein